MAEPGSAFLCADLEITPDVPEDHAAYLSTWLRVLMDDNRAIFTAASHAQRPSTTYTSRRVHRLTRPWSRTGLERGPCPCPCRGPVVEARFAGDCEC